jgi:Na+-driven multidrug efflux pump
MTPPPLGPKDAGAKSAGFRPALIAVIVAGIALLAVVIVVAVALSGIGEVEMSAAGWAAMLLGIVMTLGLGFGLMSLVFISNRRGYDERGDHHR